VLASSIPPRSVASTGRLFRGSRAVRRQLLATDGVRGFSMLAEPLRKHYATLSVWRDEVALEAFSRAHPTFG
jgi:heme-degrading monooxygenase HmoA